MAEYEEHCKVFEAIDEGRTGYLDGRQAKQLLMQSGLSTSTLRLVWDLADESKDGKLDAHEFAIAQHLMGMARREKPLPSS
ncbi:hypothetical protein GUITHDRAFT_82655, partial [Guillardia theta CCMP2712]